MTKVKQHSQQVLVLPHLQAVVEVEVQVWLAHHGPEDVVPDHDPGLDLARFPSLHFTLAATSHTSHYETLAPSTQHPPITYEPHYNMLLCIGIVKNKE